jgi:hypothetical protein
MVYALCSNDTDIISSFECPRHLRCSVNHVLNNWCITRSGLKHGVEEIVFMI